MVLSDMQINNENKVIFFVLLMSLILVTTKAAKTKTAKAPKAAKAKRVTKMDQARELYKAESDKSRKNMIAVFSAKLGLSPAAASTYFYTVKA